MRVHNLCTPHKWASSRPMVCEEFTFGFSSCLPLSHAGMLYLSLGDIILGTYMHAAGAWYSPIWLAFGLGSVCLCISPTLILSRNAVVKDYISLPEVAISVYYTHVVAVFPCQSFQCLPISQMPDHDFSLAIQAWSQWPVRSCFNFLQMLTSFLSVVFIPRFYICAIGGCLPRPYTDLERQTLCHLFPLSSRYIMRHPIRHLQGGTVSGVCFLRCIWDHDLCASKSPVTFFSLYVALTYHSE